MNAILLEKPGQFRLTQIPAPNAPPPGYALVRVHRVGVCGTDYHAFAGRQPFFSYPRVLGHEIAVQIEAVAENDPTLRPGDRCAVEPYLNCGRCVACLADRPNCCVELKMLGVHVDGGFTERMLVPIAKLHRCNTLSWDQLAVVETLALGLHAVRRAGMKEGEWVLVIGAGPLGLAAMQVAHAVGARTIAMDPSPARLEFCRCQLHIQHILDARDDPLQALRKETDGHMPAVVIDSTGNPNAMLKTFDYVAPAGRIVFLGLFPGEVSFHDPDFHKREITLLASRNSTPGDFRTVVEAIEQGTLTTGHWITHRVRWDQLIEAFPTWLDPAANVVKAVVEFAADEP